MQAQRSLSFGNTININQPSGPVNLHDNRGRPALPPEESKDETLKARFTPSEAQSIKAFCHGRRITTTDYIRSLSKLDPAYFDHIELLSHPKVMQSIVPLLEILSKKI